MSEMTMFLSEGKSQRFTETAYNDSAYLVNIIELTGESINKIPDADFMKYEQKNKFFYSFHFSNYQAETRGRELK